jgi:short-subunit dehydrogenase
MSESLRRELMVVGVDVIIVAPGSVATPIWDKAGALDATAFDNTPYAPALARLRSYAIETGRKGLPPERIGEAVKTALTAAKPKTRYTVATDSLAIMMMVTLPKRMVDNMIASRLGLKS